MADEDVGRPRLVGSWRRVFTNSAGYWGVLGGGCMGVGKGIRWLDCCGVE